LSNPNKPAKAISYIVIDFLALALGPKHCDVEIKEFKNGKSLGRLQYDINIKQLQNIDITLYDLKAKLNYREEKPLYG
jgi:hypothetical protein